MRLIKIILKRRYSLYKRLSRQRMFLLLDKASSLGDRVYTEKEADYLCTKLFYL